MADQIKKNVPNFIPMGQAGGERVRPDETVELDAEGKPINPHIPQFISKAPWYLDSGAKSSLKHQRLNEKNAGGTELKDAWYKRGERTGPAATKYRKGACENCGASSHKTKDCLERPRKVGAKWNGRDIQADEVVQSIESSWDSKRDRANGYDFDEHAALLKSNFDRLEALRAEQVGQDDESDIDGSKPQSMADKTKSNSNPHMRIREDMASYLFKGDEADETSAGDSIDKQDFTRGTNDAAAFEKLQAFAWNAGAVRSSTNKVDGTESKKGAAFDGVHMQAMPSQAALMYKKQLEAKAAEKEMLLEKYGGESKVLPTHLLETSAEQIAYSKDGTRLNPPKEVRSRYPEDVLKNGHSTVWGSWYDRECAAWGFACCHATTKNAYCLATQDDSRS